MKKNGVAKQCNMHKPLAKAPTESYLKFGKLNTILLYFIKPNILDIFYLLLIKWALSNDDYFENIMI